MHLYRRNLVPKSIIDQTYFYKPSVFGAHGVYLRFIPICGEAEHGARHSRWNTGNATGGYDRDYRYEGLGYDMPR